ncbi:MAG: phosphate ABC transporter permease subunit PstC, partial [Syntrophales bacterium]
MNRHQKEIFIRGVFAFFAFASVLLLALIVMFLFREGLPIFKEVSVADFLFGQEWYPTYDPPSYGIWPLIIGSA